MNGIIVINKEKGFTSNDVIVVLRKLLKNKKIGHAGTLDPNATGVLVVGIGSGTKLLQYITDERKMYKGEIIFGCSSDTEDFTGNITHFKFNEKKLNNDKICKAFKYFNNKKFLQEPPMYSSIKIKGKKLYEYAREGKIIERKKRSIFIYNFKQESSIYKKQNKYCLSFFAEVSKGTYIRRLCVDFGNYIKIPSIMGELKRISIGNFFLSESYKLKDIEFNIKKENYSFCKSLKFFIEKKMPIYEIKFEIAKKILQGKILPNILNLSENKLLAYQYKNEIISICKIENNKIKIIKNLNGEINEIF